MEKDLTPNAATYYKLHKEWFIFAQNNPEIATPARGVLYFYCIELCNRLRWPEKFSLPAFEAMRETGIKAYNTFRGAFEALIEIGAIQIIQRSRNQHTANVIALSNFDGAKKVALSKIDKANKAALLKIDKANQQKTPSAISKIDKATGGALLKIDEAVNKATDKANETYKYNNTIIPEYNSKQAGAPVPIEDIEGENSPVPGLKPSGGIITPPEPIKPVAGKFGENNSGVPSLQEVIAYAKQIGRDEATARDFHEVSSARNWKDSKGQPISSWRNLLAKWQQPAPKQAKAPEIPRPANADDWPDDFPELQDPAQSPDVTAAREQEARELLNRLGGLNRKAGNQPPASGHGADFDTL